jgi:hypothetical protein
VFLSFLSIVILLRLFSVIVPSILTLFVPLAARTSLGWTLFIRCLIGLLESPSFPAVYHFFPVWIPLPEKTLMIPAVASGMYLGEIFGFSLSGVFVETDLQLGDQDWGGWQLVFYVFGLCGILWFPYWAFFAYETPDDHPSISEGEKAYLKEGKGYSSVKDVEDEDTRYDNLLRQPLAHEEHDLDGNYRSPSMEGPVNPMTRRSFSSRHSTDDVNGPTALDIDHDHEQKLLSDIDREELAKRIPWGNFFTHPVSLTLFINNWVYVRTSHSLFLFYHLTNFIFVGIYWIHFVVRDAIVLHRYLRIRFGIGWNFMCFPLFSIVLFISCIWWNF